LAGESDLAIIDPRYSRFIADIVNTVNPGSGTFQLIPETNHFMGKVGNRQTALRHRQLGTYTSIQYNYNDEIGEAVSSWIRTIEQTGRD